MAYEPNPLTDECMSECARCAALCARTAHHCLRMGGDHASLRHQGLLRDCAHICTVAVDFMARESEFAPAICRGCVEICTACARGCEAIHASDALMRRCAEACRACAASCERMATPVA